MAIWDEYLVNNHGGWNPKDNPAFAQVPKGTTVKFYTGNFKIMLLGVPKDEVSALKCLEQFRAATPNQEGTEYNTVPNYVLSPLGTSDPVPDWVYRVTSDTPLCSNDGSDPDIVCDSGIHRCNGLFADDNVVGATLYFAACRYVEMEHVGSPEFYAETGINQRQPKLGHEQQGTVELDNATTDLFLDEMDRLTSEDEAGRWAAEKRKNLSDDQWAMVERRIKQRFPNWEPKPEPVKAGTKGNLFGKK